MIIRTAILAITLATVSCTPQTSVDYADGLRECLTEADISMLNEACQTFETHLSKKYGRQELGQAYETFLLDIQAMNLPPSFFITPDSKKILEKITASKTFDKIWTKLSSVQSYDDIEIYTPDGPDQLQNEFDSYCTNPNGVYLDCLIKRNKNKVIADYLKTVREVPGMSPGLAASVLMVNLKKEDFDEGLTRLIIAVGFYYEIGLLFDKEINTVANRDGKKATRANSFSFLNQK